MVIQRSQSIRVVRTMPGPKSAARFPRKVPPWPTATAGTSALSSGSRCVLPRWTTSASIRATSASASAERPRCISQRGDSGRDLRHQRSIAMGRAVMIWTMRQPSREAGTTK